MDENNYILEEAAKKVKNKAEEENRLTKLREEKENAESRRQTAIKDFVIETSNANPEDTYELIKQLRHKDFSVSEIIQYLPENSELLKEYKRLNNWHHRLWRHEYSKFLSKPAKLISTIALAGFTWLGSTNLPEIYDYANSRQHYEWTANYNSKIKTPLLDKVFGGKLQSKNFELQKADELAKIKVNLDSVSSEINEKLKNNVSSMKGLLNAEVIKRENSIPYLKSMKMIKKSIDANQLDFDTLSELDALATHIRGTTAMPTSKAVFLESLKESILSYQSKNLEAVNHELKLVESTPQVKKAYDLNRSILDLSAAYQRNEKIADKAKTIAAFAHGEDATLGKISKLEAEKLNLISNKTNEIMDAYNHSKQVELSFDKKIAELGQNLKGYHLSEGYHTYTIQNRNGKYHTELTFTDLGQKNQLDANDSINVETNDPQFYNTSSWNAQEAANQILYQLKH